MPVPDPSDRARLFNMKTRYQIETKAGNLLTGTCDSLIATKPAEIADALGTWVVRGFHGEYLCLYVEEATAWAIEDAEESKKLDPLIHGFESRPESPGTCRFCGHGEFYETHIAP